MKRAIINKADPELAKVWANRSSGGQKEVIQNQSESIYKASQQAIKLIEGLGQPFNKKDVTPVQQENFMDDDSDF